MPAYKILVMEDDDMTAELIDFLLRRQGHDVRIEKDGRAGLTALSEFRPDILLLDILMPFLDGLSVLAQVRQSADTRKLPVLMLTAKTSENDIVRALDMGANDYLVKPFQPAELLARINRLSREFTA